MFYSLYIPSYNILRLDGNDIESQSIGEFFVCVLCHLATAMKISELPINHRVHFDELPRVISM